MNMSNLRIGTRLGAGFALILLLLAGVSLLGINALARLDTALHHIVDVNLKKIGLVEDMMTSVHTVARVTRTIALLSDATEAAKQQEKVGTARTLFDTAFDAMSAMPLDDAGKVIVARIPGELGAARTVGRRPSTKRTTLAGAAN